jgi:PAS domain S-box-containing protein
MVSNPERPSVRILIVEDEIVIAADLDMRLQGMGYEVTGAVNSAEDALILAERDRPDLVFMDIILSGPMDGIEAAGQIRARMGIPVVFLTAYADNDRLSRAKLTQPFGYLLKPFQDRDIRIAVEMALYSARIEAERREAERRLRRSEEQYRAIVTNMAEGIAIGQGDRLVLTNPALARITGYSQDQLQGRPFVEFVHPDDRSSVLNRHLSRVQGAEPEGMNQYRLVTSSGETRWVQANAMSHEWAGRPASLCFYMDITQQKKDEEALARRDRVLAAISYAGARFLAMDALSQEGLNEVLGRLGQASEADRVYIFENRRDSDGVLLTSQRYEWAASGITAQIGNPDLTDFPYGAAGFGRWEQILGAGGIVSGAIHEFSKEEREILEPQDIRSLLVVPVFVGGNWWGFMGLDQCRSHRDWSLVEIEALKTAAGMLGGLIRRMGIEDKLKEASREMESRAEDRSQELEAALKESETKFYRVFQAIPAAVSLSRLDDGRYTEINQGFTRMYGYEPREVLGRTALDLGLWADLPQQSEARWERIIAEGHVRDFEFRFRRKNGQAGIGLNSALVILDGGQSHILSISTDVTERRKTEEIMLQAEKMMSIGGLAAGMAHEINNPLGGIILGAQNILRRLARDNDANRLAADELGLDLDRVGAYMAKRRVNDFLGGILEAAHRAARITANMLEFSRRGRGEMRPVDLRGIADKALELAATDYDLKKQYDFRQFKIVRDYEDLMPMVWCDPTQMEQVVFNLIKNAAQALAADVDHQAAHQIVLRVRSERPEAVIEVEDDGPGIDEPIRKRIFEPFFTTKPPGVGTGLGLSVSYFLITENHKGTITVDSEPGRGARFQIRLPARPPLAGMAEG